MVLFRISSHPHFTKYQDTLKAFVKVGSADFRSFELADIDNAADLTRSGSDLSNFGADVVRPNRNLELVGSSQGQLFEQICY